MGERRGRFKAEKTAQVPEDLILSAEQKPVAPSSSSTSRLEDLQSMRDTLREAVRTQAVADASKLAPLSKELREVLREIDSIEGDQQSGAGDPFDDFLSGGGDPGNITRFPAPADRQAS